jgi:hypothetical protein
LDLRRKKSQEAEENNNKELHNLYTSPNVITAIKSRRMRKVGQVACTGAS